LLGSVVGSLKRQTVTITAAMLLPLLILAAIQIYSILNGRRDELESLSKARAEEVMRLVDVEISGQVRLARLLGSASALKHDNIPAVYTRAREFRAIAGGWRTVRLSDPSTGVELFDLRRPLASATTAVGPDVLAYARTAPSRPLLGSVMTDAQGSPAIPVQVPVLRGRQLRYVLTVEIDPTWIQLFAVPRFPPESLVSAIVDRDGQFISRSLNYAQQVGRHGSVDLRAAVKRRGRGFYRNVTLEGVASYTAYVTSLPTGWSTHVAVPASPFDAARLWSAALWLGVSFGCLALAGVLTWWTLRGLAIERAQATRLQQSQKMEAVGHLTGGIAHDFNNLLTAIIGSLDLVLRRAALDERNRSYLEGALDAARRGAKLTSRLLAFSRTESLTIEAVDIQETLSGMSGLIDQSLGPTIEVRFEVDPDARWVSTDRNQLELALLNLAVNARDAMPDGGRLTFSAKRHDHHRAARAWSCVALTIADTGTGMEPDVLAHALDPFFTTKGVNKGTGLGLAQVYALASQSDGDVEIDSEVGRGTRVHIMLPLAAEGRSAKTVSETSQEQDELPSLKGKRILVLDDDDTVRHVLVESLRAHGCVVFQASSGEDALGALADIRPDLFMLDFVMPGMNGAEVARRARKLRPDQRLLIVSGYLDEVELADLVPDVPILKKPFDGPTLALRVAQVLSASMTSTVAKAPDR
jgi:signal transduction histidine kinase/CheY-like chemotaxis protein